MFLSPALWDISINFIFSIFAAHFYADYLGLENLQASLNGIFIGLANVSLPHLHSSPVSASAFAPLTLLFLMH